MDNKNRILWEIQKFLVREGQEFYNRGDKMKAEEYQKFAILIKDNFHPNIEINKNINFDVEYPCIFK